MNFTYKGIDSKGQSISGAVEAVDRKAAIADLATQGCFATEIDESTGKSFATGAASVETVVGGAGVHQKDVLAMTTQLSTALKAGLPILKALEIIRDQQKKPGMIAILDDLAGAVSSGESISDAMGKYPKTFNTLYLSMVRVGETGGILEKTLDQLVGLLAREQKIHSNLVSAAAYPLFVMAIGVLSMVIMLVGILPQIINTIGTEPENLPGPTRILMGFSHFLLYYGWLAVIGIVAGLYFFNRWKQTESGRFGWDAFKLKVPLFGNVIRSLSVGRFARMLGSLIMSGVTILEALKVVRDTLGNEVLARQIDYVAGEVKTGHPLAEPLDKSGDFPPLLVQIVAIGEQTGKLDELLLNAAETFDEQADSVMSRFLSLFPSILILLLAVAIFFIIAATLLPIVAMDMSGM